MLDLTRRGLFGILAGILTTPLRSLWPARAVTDDTIVYADLTHMWSRMPAPGVIKGMSPMQYARESIGLSVEEYAALVKNDEPFWARTTKSDVTITWDRDGLMKIVEE